MISWYKLPDRVSVENPKSGNSFPDSALVIKAIENFFLQILSQEKNIIPFFQLFQYIQFS
jgi:hypothetical protein